MAGNRKIVPMTDTANPIENTQGLTFARNFPTGSEESINPV